MLTGTVKDSSGAVIPNAQVAINGRGHRDYSQRFGWQLGILYSPQPIAGNLRDIGSRSRDLASQLQKGLTLTVRGLSRFLISR